MNVVPAVWVGLFGLFSLSVASAISATGPAARSSAASSIPPGLPISRSAFSSRVLVSAKGRRLGKIRPNRSSRMTKTCGRDRCATAAEGSSTLEAPAATAPAPSPRRKVRLLSVIGDVLLQQWVTNFRCGSVYVRRSGCSARREPRRAVTGTLRNHELTYRWLTGSFLTLAKPRRRAPGDGEESVTVLWGQKRRKCGAKASIVPRGGFSRRAIPQRGTSVRFNARRAGSLDFENRGRPILKTDSTSSVAPGRQ